MGLMNSALYIGRNALLSYQGALQVVGGNISSAGSPDYTRLTPELGPLQGIAAGNGLQPGAGVALDGIRRNVDDALENRVRLASGDVESRRIEQSTMAQVETFFDNVSGAGVASRLNDFFNNFDDLQARPEDVATRDLVISSGQALAASLSSLRTSLTSLGEDLDRQIQGLVVEADDLARRIAELNERITRSEAAKPGQATGLRDQRDGMLRELGKILDITVREQPDGAINVYAGSEALIQSGRSRGLATTERTENGITRTGIVFADGGSTVATHGGQLAGLIRSRDARAFGQVAAVDEMAAALIADVNRVHADGQGLTGYRSVVGEASLLATDVPLGDAATGLTTRPSGGSFFLAVTDDATNTVVAYRINVRLDGADGDTTLESLASDITNTVDGVTASVTVDGRLKIDADDGLSFTFGHDGQAARTDSSGVLSALGINTFFQGTDARDIGISAAIASDPNRVAAAATDAVGDGGNAGRLAELETRVSPALNGRSLVDGFTTIATDVAVVASGANAAADASSAILSALSAQRESISGVSLDEEAVELLKFERAFQGASRYVSVVDDLLNQLMALIA